MHIIKRIAAAAAAFAVIFAASGCGKAIVLQGESLDNSTTIYYNGNDLSGVPIRTEPPAAVTTQKPQSATETGTAISEDTSAQSTAEASGTHGTSQSQSMVHTTADDTEEATAAPQTSTAPQTSSSAAVLTPSTPEQTKPQTTPAPLPEDKLPPNSYSALNYNEVKGVWISYFELYPILTGKNREEFAAGIGGYYDNAVSLGINTVYVHVRPYGDSMYESEYYPWSKYCTGYIGEDPGFDPLAVMIDEAHKRRLSFHAWINPLRCSQKDDMPQIEDVFPTKQWYNSADGEYIIKVDSYWYLNPAYDEVTDLIASGAAEIVSRYDVDGVHIDDYFYPTTDSSYDQAAFSASGYDSLSKFRLDNCTEMVSKLYKAVKSHNPTALFGISTQGNVSNNVDVLYADVERWCRQDDCCDYMAPQIYYGFKNSGQPFAQVVEQWDEMLEGTGKKLIPGLAVYKIGAEDAWAGDGVYEWINDREIIRRQIECSRTAENYGGIILYSYQFIFNPDSGVSQAVNNEIAAFEPLLG